MAGAAITVELDAAAARGIDALGGLDKAELLDGLARLVQEQTRRRIRETKTGPDGERWPPNRAGTSTLVRSGALMRSIDYVVAGDEAHIGSGLVYSRIHQYGGTIRPKNAKALRFQVGTRLVFAGKVTMPARPYLGVSAEDQEEIEATAVDFIALVLGERGAE